MSSCPACCAYPVPRRNENKPCKKPEDSGQRLNPLPGLVERGLR